MDYATIISGKNLLLGAAVVALCATAKASAPEFFRSHWGMRVMPVLPLLLGVIGALLGVTDAVTVGDKIVNGLVSGFGAGQAFKIARTSVLAYDVPPRPPRMDKPSEVVPEEPAVQEPPADPEPVVPGTPVEPPKA